MWSQCARLVKAPDCKAWNGKIPSTYSSALRTFALSTHLYSPNAYRYARKVFDTCLPHPRTVKNCHRCVGSGPGFTQPALSTLKLRVDIFEMLFYLGLHIHFSS